MENRCSEICSQNPWKIPMKKFIFSKVAGWQSATFSRVPWGFYQTKKCVKIEFFAGFILRQKRPGRRLCDFIKNELQRYFSRIFTENFPWQLSEQLFIRTSSFPGHLCGCFRTLFSSSQIGCILFVVFLISPVCCFVMFTPIIKYNFHKDWFEHRKKVLGIWDNDWYLTKM